MTTVLHSVIALLLLTAAAVQINDPDGALWIAIYAVAALGPTLMIFGRRCAPAFAAGAAACLLGACLSASGFWDYVWNHRSESLMQSMSRDTMYIEETREFLGALIALALIALSLWRAKRQPRRLREE